MMISKQFIATACVAAVMAVSTPGADAWRHHMPVYKKEYKKTKSNKVSGYNKNAGLNYGKMFNADANVNHVGSHQSGHITGTNVGTNAQDNYQTVDASPTIVQSNHIQNNPYVYSGNTNNNQKYKNVRKYSPDVHYRKDYKECPRWGSC